MLKKFSLKIHFAIMKPEPLKSIKNVGSKLTIKKIEKLGFRRFHLLNTRNIIWIFKIENFPGSLPQPSPGLTVNMTLFLLFCYYATLPIFFKRTPKIWACISLQSHVFFCHFHLLMWSVQLADDTRCISKASSLNTRTINDLIMK